MERIEYTWTARDFEWLDGTNVDETYDNFADGEPNNHNNPEGCGVFCTCSGLWKSEKCESRYYVCQRETG